MENLAPTGEEDVVQWKKLKDGFEKIDGWIRANGEGSRYVMGDNPCYADLWIAAYALWIKLVLPKKWDDVKSWHGGRWAKLVQEMEKYEAVV